MSTPVQTPVAAPAAVPGPARDAMWLRDARRARLVSWLSLAWMTVEGAVGVSAGLIAGSVALTGFGLSSVVEGTASVIVIWRFTGARTHSATSERSAHRAVAVSFWLLTPYIAVESINKLATSEHPQTSTIGIALTTASLVLMPVLGRAKQRLGARLDSLATAGEGTQNVLCALMAAAALIGLLGQTLLGAWWLDALAGLFIAAVAIREGFEAWGGEACTDCAPVGFADGCSSTTTTCATGCHEPSY